jgi:hypothetical protein
MRSHCSRGRRRVALTLATVAACLAPAAPAQALEHPFLEELGTGEKPELRNAAGLAVDQATDDLLILDGISGSAATVLRFHPDGSAADFAALGTNVIDGRDGPDATPQNKLQFGSPSETQIAVDSSCALHEPPLTGSTTPTCAEFDPADGDIYVTDRFATVIDIFSREGAYLGQLTAAGVTSFSEACGVAADSSGAVYVGDYSGGIRKFVPAANPPVNADNTATFTSTAEPCTLAAGSGPTAGFLFPAEFDGPVSKVDSSTGALKYTVDASSHTTVSADPASGHLYAAAGSAVKELDASGVASASLTHVIATCSIVQGVAVDRTSGRVYVSRAGSSQIAVYGPTIPTPPTIGEACSHEDAWTASAGVTEATLKAKVDPNGLQSAYHVEYVDQASFEASGFTGAQSAPVPDGALPGQVTGKANFTSGSATLTNLTTSAGAFAPHQAISGTGIPAGTTILAVDAVQRTLALSAAVTSGANTNRPITATGPQPIAVQLSGLAPATAYRWRLVASNSAGPTTGPQRSLTTNPAPSASEPCANDPFRIGAGAALPDCRAYEMVSPIDKDGSDINSLTKSDGTPVGRNQSDLMGNKIAFTAEQRFGDAVSQPYAPQYIASRGEEGWSTHGISPPRGIYTLNSPTAASRNEFQAFSDDLCSAWLLTDPTTAPPLAPGGATEAFNLYERSNCGAEGYRTLLGDIDESTVVQGIAQGGAITVYHGPGGLFIEAGKGSPASLCRLPDETSLGGNCSSNPFAGIDGLAEDGSRVYWTRGALFVRVNPLQPQSELEHGAATGTGKLVSGSAEVSEVSTSSGEFQVGQTVTAARGIPAGTTIAAVGAGTLTLSAAASESRSGEPLSAYSRCTEPEKACTVAVSEQAPSTGPVELTTRKATLLGASREGSAALFAFDPDRTGADEGPAEDDLYRFDAASGTVAPIAHNVLGVMGASENLSRVYLVSEEVLDETPKETAPGVIEVAAKGKPNLYLYEAGAGFRFIGTLTATDARKNAEFEEPSPLSTIAEGHRARVSADGSVAAFVSYAPLTGYDNTDAASGETDLEVFRYQAATGRLDCVSCNPSGARPVGFEVKGLGAEVQEEFHSYWAAATIPPGQHSLYFPRALSDDGSRVFFDSYDSLVLSDTNGKMDAYEWESPGKGTCTTGSPAYRLTNHGCLYLISSGQNPRKSTFVDATPNGSDVFFTTGQSLVAQDPGLIDLYDARELGGFPQPPAPQPPCEGEACQSPPPPPPPLAPSSATFQGPSNKHPRKRCARGKRRVTRHGKARCVRKRHRKAHSHSRRPAR